MEGEERGTEGFSKKQRRRDEEGWSEIGWNKRREIKITRKREIINQEEEKDHVKHALHTPD